MLLWLISSAAALTALGTFYRWGWPVVRGIVHFADALPALMAIAEEFKPNGDGKSLVDRLARIELRLDDVSQQLEWLLNGDD